MWSRSVANTVCAIGTVYARGGTSEWLFFVFFSQAYDQFVGSEGRPIADWPFSNGNGTASIVIGNGVRGGRGGRIWTRKMRQLLQPNTPAWSGGVCSGGHDMYEAG